VYRHNLFNPNRSLGYFPVSEGYKTVSESYRKVSEGF
jgi:hypothetical protein